MYVFDTQKKTDPGNTYKFLLSHSKWNSVDLFLNRLCGPAAYQQRDDSKDLVEIAREGRGQLTARCNRIPVMTLQYMAADPLFSFGGKKRSCARISPNCQVVPTQTGILCGKVGFLTLHGFLCGGACAAMRSSKMPWP